MVKLWIKFVLFVIFNIFSLCDVNVKNYGLTDDTYIWQGFNHKWERRILNFFTPHRIGSIGSRFLNESYLKNSTSTKFEFIFTPGVNGDYAFPSSNFSLIYSNLEQYSKFSKTQLNFNFSDYAEGEPPIASTKVIQNITIPTYDFPKVQSVLNGFKLLMECIGAACNSNGIWPSQFYIDISNCYQINSEYICLLEFILERGWTPDKGAGKAFNYEMSYNLEIDILNIHSNENNLSVYDDNLNFKSSLHDEPIYLKRNTGLSLEGNKITGISSFGFEFKKYKNYNALGRYIGALQFEIGNHEEDFYHANINLSSAKWTTYNSPIEFSLKTKTLNFKDKFIRKNMQVKGRVCKEDHSTLFFCYFKGIPNKQIDIVNITSNLN